MSTWNPQANKILLEALEMDELDARQKFLDQACSGNPELRSAVDELLKAHAQAGQFLKTESDHARATSQLATETRPLFVAGTTLAGRYVVQRELGQGGMGVVFLADQTHPVRRQVAIKLIKGGIDVRSVAARFEQERNALALMEHPNIAKILDAGVVDLATGAECAADVVAADDFRRGVPFFAMEYIQGVPINDYCDRHRLSPQARLKLFIPVCQAVQHAHQKGIVHRDLKPSNILVETIDGQPIPKVIDFGVAKATGAQLTEQSLHTSFGSIVGTLEYMSPEQARRSNDIDTRTDVYALGVILYELLAGSVPHSRDDLQQAGLEEMLRIINEVDPLAPSSKLSNSGSLPNIATERAVVPSRLVRIVRGDLDWIVLKALDKERNRRYESVAGLAADIQRYLDEEPVLARPPSTMYRLQKAYRRHRAAFVAAGLAITLLVLGILGTSTGFVAASRNANVAKAEAVRASAAERQVRDALEEVKQQRDETETQKQISDAITNFLLVDLLQQADVIAQANHLLEKGPADAENLLKKNPTILELVDRAVKELTPIRIEEKFPGQPLLHAALLTNVGYVYKGIGEFEKAIGLLRRAHAIFEKELGAGHEKTLHVMQYLAVALSGVERHEESLELTVERHGRFEEQFGKHDERTLYSFGRLAAAYARANRLKESIAVANEAMALCEQSTELDDDVDREGIKAFLEFTLAVTYIRAGRSGDAVQPLERLYQRRIDQLGPGHPNTLTSGTWLAGAYVRLNENDKAMPLLQSIVPRLETLYGPDHPVTVGTMETLAACHRRTGEPERAVAIYEASLPRRMHRYGPDSVNTLRTTANLGVNYYESGRLDDAIAKLTEVYDRGRSEPAVHWAVEPLSRALEKNGEVNKAEQICRDHLQHVKHHFSDQPKCVRAALFTLALNLLGQEKHSEAEPVLRELIVMNERHAPDHWNTFNTKCLLGTTLMAQDRLHEAESLLAEGYAGMKARQAKIQRSVRFHLHDATEALVQLYERLEDEEQAERWRDELKSLEAEETKPR